MQRLFIVWVVIAACVGIFSIVPALAETAGESGPGEDAGKAAPSMPLFKASEQDIPPEYVVKAVLLHKFLGYVDWPKSSPAYEHGGINICILGDVPKRDLEDFMTFSEGESAKKLRRSGEIIFLKSVAEHDMRCHVTFIARSESSSLRKTLSELEGKPTLTVSDIKGFVGKGGMIEFIVDKSKVNWLANITATMNTPLKIDSELYDKAYGSIGKKS